MGSLLALRVIKRTSDFLGREGTPFLNMANWLAMQLSKATVVDFVEPVSIPLHPRRWHMFPIPDALVSSYKCRIRIKDNIMQILRKDVAKMKRRCCSVRVHQLRTGYIKPIGANVAGSND